MGLFNSFSGSTLAGSGNPPVFFTFSFTGLYLDIVVIAQAVGPIPNTSISTTNATVTVDGESTSYSNQLVQGSDKDKSVGYSQSLYSKGWTTNNKHDVRVELDSRGSILSLDYIAYSVEMEDEAVEVGSM